MRFFKPCLLIVVLIACGFRVAFAEGATKSIREELKEILAEQGFSDGVDRKARAVVGIGISWSEKEPELVARALAAGRISCLLNGAELRAIRNAVEYGDGAVLSTVVRKVSEGYVTGAREVARVTRRDGNGRIAVGIALRWTLDQEIEAAKAVSVPRREVCALEEELKSVEHISRMSGAQFWVDDRKKRSWLLGIGVHEIKSADAKSIRAAIRLAQVKARRYLSFHFCQYNRGAEVHKREFREDDATLASEFDSLHIVKSKGVIAPGFGMEDVYEDVVTENDRRFAVCVACLIDSDND